MASQNISAKVRFDEPRAPGFERMARQYDKSRGEFPAGVLLKGLQASLSRDLSALKGKDVLDAGAGTGQISAALLSTGANVTGADISPAMLQIAKDRCSAFPGFRPVEADLCRLPFADSSFDLITTRWVLEFIPGWRTALQEMRRVLRPGGELVIIFTNNMLRTTPRALFEDIAHRRGLRVGLPGATNRLLAAYLKYMGAQVTAVSPPELYWDREIPVETTLWEMEARLLNHLYEIPDYEYESVLAEVKAVIAGRYPEGLVDRPTITTELWHAAFVRGPSAPAGVKFQSFLAASHLKRTAPRLYHRTLTRVSALTGR